MIMFGGSSRDNHQFTKENGMSVPCGHTQAFIRRFIEDTVFDTVDIVLGDGTMTSAKYQGKKEGSKYIFKEVPRMNTIALSASDIHLISLHSA